MADIVYLTWNRLEFTRFSFEKLIENTEWDRVDRLYVYDDVSEDGTTEYMRAAIEAVPVTVEFTERKMGSPCAVMNEYIAHADSELWAKIDSDIVVPPGWLGDMIAVMESHPEVELLGMEGGRMGVPDVGQPHGFTDSSHIGGVGLMRTKAFKSRPPVPVRDGRFGFTEWQEKQSLVRGWITPDLLVCCLDMVPVEPWVSLSETYIEKGWQRRWSKYDPRYPYYYEWWMT